MTVDDIDAVARAILKAEGERLSPDRVVEASGLPPAIVQAALVLLRQTGLVVDGDDGGLCAGPDLAPDTALAELVVARLRAEGT